MVTFRIDCIYVANSCNVVGGVAGSYFNQINLVAQIAKIGLNSNDMF